MSVEKLYTHYFFEVFYDESKKGNFNDCFTVAYGNALLNGRQRQNFKSRNCAKQIAKYRKSAFHKWSEYQIEGTPQEKAYYFYSSYYNNSGNYVRKTGDLGTSAEYERLISNEGK